ncbi:MAG: hypothetical protein ABW211_00405 [Acidimicrobiia bacterium]
MAQALEPAESRARGKRLIIIFVVVFVFFASAGVWRYLQNRAIDDKTDAATAELRRDWRPVDLASLQSAYAAADAKAFAANDGDYSAMERVFPPTRESTMGAREFGPDGAFVAEYLVQAQGRERCLVVHVRPPTPNRVQIQQRDGDC